MLCKQGYPSPQKDFYKVYVRSVTYNQVSYIEDCLQGVALQNTTFPFVHHVVDDASTDGEQDAIKAWMLDNCDMENAEFYDNDTCSITVVKNRTNPNCTLVVYFLKKNLHGNPKKQELFYPWEDVCTYEAICEGDDYWIDMRKLQIQTDFLDHNAIYGACYTNNKRKIEKEGIIINDKQVGGDISYSKMLRGNRITALTSVCRISILRNYYFDVIPSQRGWLQGDYPKWLYFAYYSKIRCLDEYTAVYRVVEGSISNQCSLNNMLRYIDSVASIRLYYIDKFGDFNGIKNQ